MGSRNSGNCSSAMTSSRLALKVLVITTIVCGTFTFTATGTTPVTELKEETSRILAERVKTGHWQTLSATSGGEGTEKWIPATPATDMVVTEDLAERRDPCSDDEYDDGMKSPDGDIIPMIISPCSDRRQPQQQRPNAAQRAQRDQQAVDQSRRRSGGATRRRRDSLAGVFG